MVRKINRDPLFLMQKSEDASEADRQVVTDLLDTLKANEEIPATYSAKTLADMDKAISNFKAGTVSSAIDLSDFD